MPSPNEFPLCPAPVKTLTGRVVSLIRLNTVLMHVRDGRRLVTKRKSPFGRTILPAANVFFRTASVPIQFWLDSSDWQRWEVNCFRRLNPGFTAAPVADGGICEDRLPGEALATHLKRQTLTLRMVKAAARELCRAHGLWSDYYEGLWSHGDAAMCNFIYDPALGRTRLIDFELTHHRSLPAVLRHADDVSAFLLDMASGVSDRRWLPYALAFLRTYNHPAVAAELHDRLVVPRGLGRFWWGVRTNFAPPGPLVRRLEMLREALTAVDEPTTQPALADDSSRPPSLQSTATP